MDTLHLVAPDHRDAATQIPIFDYEKQPFEEIRGTLLEAYGQKYGPPSAIPKEEVLVPRDDNGLPVRAPLYRPVTGAARGAVLHVHGGGCIAGTADMMAAFSADIANRHGLIVLSVDYSRVAEATGDVALDECFVALSWLRGQAAQLGFDADRIAVMGDSADGNLAAGIALRARDAGISLAAQLLIYPALDDRTGGPYAPVDNQSPVSSSSPPSICISYGRRVWHERRQKLPLISRRPGHRS